MSDKPKFHMIRSVKGGSGKTAFALRTVVDLTVNGVDKKVLYIDADVHASETYSRLVKTHSDPGRSPDGIVENGYFVDFYSKGESNSSLSKHYLNSYIHSYLGYYSKLEEIMLPARLRKVHNINVNTSPSGSDETYELGDLFESDNEIHFIFPDPSRCGRAVFGNIFQSSGRSAIGVGAYVAKMKSLLNYVCERGFTDVVVDMPPGSDTFSDHLSEIIIEMVEDKCDLAIYYVANDDFSHLHSSASDAISYLHQSRTAYVNEVYLVCNEGREGTEKCAIFEKKENLTKKLKPVLLNDVTNGATERTEASIEFELGRLNYKKFSHDWFYYKSQRNNSCTIFSIGKLVEDLP